MSHEFKESGATSCYYAYFRKDQVRVNQNCQLTTIPDPPLHLVTELTPNKFFIFSNKERPLTAHCGNLFTDQQPHITLPKGNSIIEIQPGCSLEDDQILLYGTQTYRSTITNNARDAINKQIKDYTKQITNIDLTQIDEVDDIILPKVQFHDTQQMNRYLKQLAEDLSPIMNKEMIGQWNDKSTDHMLIAGSILLFLLIAGTVTILSIYYFRNKKGLVWISQIAKQTGLADAAEFIKTLTYKMSQVSEPEQEKSVARQFQDAQGTMTQALSQIQSTTQQQRAIALSSFQPSPIRVASQPQLNTNETQIYPRLYNPVIMERSSVPPPGYIHTE
jgi:hypothetical protein